MKSSSLAIACIAADLKPGALGGAEMAAVETIKRLSKSHSIIVFVGNNTNIRSLFPKNVDVIPIYYPRIPNLMGVFYILFGIPQIVWHLMNKPVDVLWAKQEFPQAVVGAIVKKILKKPLYVTIQNPRMHEEELVVTGATRFLKQFLPKLLTPLLSWSYTQADTLAAVSTCSARETRNMGGKNVIVIPNGVDVSAFAQFRKKISSNGVFTILTTSSLIPRNGIDTLIAAVALLPQNIRWRLVIAGEGPECQRLKLTAKSLKLDEKISFLGRVANSKIPELLSEAHLFVRPSRFEGFGVSFIEAMAAGVPVIGTPVGGIPDFITHLKTGLLVEPDNPHQLASTIQTLIANKKLRELMATQALKLVKQRYTWETVAHKVEATMTSLKPET